MKRIYHTGSNITLQNRAVLSGGSFCIPCLMEMRMTRTRMEKTGKNIQPLTDRRTTGQSWQTLLFGRQGRALRVSRKNHPRCAPVFFPKALPFRKRLP
ncbi:hypothetical protein PN606_17000 [Parabacteroides distasonis]|uniref:hypothetical protein n=1 Tax=Parabacteroides distasonis TaxID=823 RepID=UPI001E4037E6|nr:hypothetical protein [Parabacteroides distasonis]MDB9039797.1 hypothetical protein [Parabacteroides distasonis]